MCKKNGKGAESIDWTRVTASNPWMDFKVVCTMIVVGCTPMLLLYASGICLNNMGMVESLDYGYNPSYVGHGNTTTGEFPRVGHVPPHGGPVFEMPTLRGDLGKSLQAYGARTGVELGVKQGDFASVIMHDWLSCTAYYLVDAWQPMHNYKDHANVGIRQHLDFFEQARSKMHPYSKRTRIYFMPMLTSQAVGLVLESSVDFVYVDARHDFCGVLADIDGWWPKLKPGGIMAGHDFLTASDVRKITPEQDWGLCGDGSRNEGAVKGAVQQFARERGLAIQTTRDTWPTWVVQKGW